LDSSCTNNQSMWHTREFPFGKAPRLDRVMRPYLEMLVA
jgi:hypothetical protein